MTFYSRAKKYTKKRIVKPYTSTKGGRGYRNRMNLYKEVTAIKRMVNAEKQNADSNDTTIYTVAQHNGAATGSRVVSVLPSIAQGSSEDQRKGDSVKLSSMCFQLEVTTNSFNTLSDVNYTCYIVRQPRNPVGAASFALANDFLEDNVSSGVIDYNSNRNYQHFKDFIVVGKINGTLKQNTNDSLNQIRKNQHKLCKKLDYHVRYDKGTTNVLNNDLHLVFVTDSGDRATNDYIKFQYSNKVYYYDN